MLNNFDEKNKYRNSLPNNIEVNLYKNINENNEKKEKFTEIKEKNEEKSVIKENETKKNENEENINTLLSKSNEENLFLNNVTIEIDKKEKKRKKSLLFGKSFISYLKTKEETTNSIKSEENEIKEKIKNEEKLKNEKNEEKLKNEKNEEKLKNEKNEEVKDINVNNLLNELINKNENLNKIINEMKGTQEITNNEMEIKNQKIEKQNEENVNLKNDIKNLNEKITLLTSGCDLLKQNYDILDNENKEKLKILKNEIEILKKNLLIKNDELEKSKKLNDELKNQNNHDIFLINDLDIKNKNVTFLNSNLSEQNLKNDELIQKLNQNVLNLEKSNQYYLETIKRQYKIMIDHDHPHIVALLWGLIGCISIIISFQSSINPKIENLSRFVVGYFLLFSMLVYFSLKMGKNLNFDTSILSILYFELPKNFLENLQKSLVSGISLGLIILVLDWFLFYLILLSNFPSFNHLYFIDRVLYSISESIIDEILIRFVLFNFFMYLFKKFKNFVKNDVFDKDLNFISKFKFKFYNWFQQKNDLVLYSSFLTILFHLYFKLPIQFLIFKPNSFFQYLFLSIRLLSIHTLISYVFIHVFTTTEKIEYSIISHFFMGLIIYGFGGWSFL
jgi:hypothetical protein